MLKLLQLALIALSAVSAAGLGMSVVGSSEPPSQQKNQTAEQRPQRESNDKNEQQKSFREWLAIIWRRTLIDPVAFFTFWLAVFSFGLFVVAGLQILLLLRAETVATKAANAAQESAQIAERALIAGQRAFVSATSRNFFNRDAKSGEVNGWGFSVIWENAGDTPTRNLINHTNLVVRDTELPQDWDFPDNWGNIPPDKRQAVPLGAAPKSGVESNRHFIPLADAQAATQGKKFIYIWGWATYNDVFPKTALHVTRFSFQITMSGDASNPDRTTVTFPYLPRYNCSDEECDRQGFPANWTPRAVTE